MTVHLSAKIRRPLSWTMTYVLLSFLFLWAFLGTIDGPALKIESNLGHVIYNTPKIVHGEHAGQLAPLWIIVIPREPLPVHASFLLFDFKQNLRRWPNVASDISRSPPFFVAS